MEMSSGAAAQIIRTNEVDFANDPLGGINPTLLRL